MRPESSAFKGIDLLGDSSSTVGFFFVCIVAVGKLDLAKLDGEAQKSWALFVACIKSVALLERLLQYGKVPYALNATHRSISLDVLFGVIVKYLVNVGVSGFQGLKKVLVRGQALHQSGLEQLLVVLPLGRDVLLASFRVC